MGGMGHGGRSERGATTPVMAAVLVVVLLATGVTLWLLIRTVDAASDINAKAERIARNGRGINMATDSVVQLRRTNRTALSILDTARPLDRKLTKIVQLARSVDGTAGGIDSAAGTIGSTAGDINRTAGDINGSATAIDGTAGSINTSAGRIDSSAGAINGTAGAINGTAGRIDAVAGGINSNAARILSVARKIDTDAALINMNLDATIDLARAVKADSGNILGQAEAAHQTSACIDRRLGGSSGNDGHCR